MIKKIGSKQVLLLLLASLTLATIITTSNLIHPWSAKSEPIYLPHGDLTDCVGKQMDLIKPDKIQLDFLDHTLEFCYRKIHGQGLLDEFNLRRSVFSGQANQTRVLLILVVVITISGVSLAIAQLFISYRLTVLGKGNLGDYLVDKPTPKMLISARKNGSEIRKWTVQLRTTLGRSRRRETAFYTAERMDHGLPRPALTDSAWSERSRLTAMTVFWPALVKGCAERPSCTVPHIRSSIPTGRPRRIMRGWMPLWLWRAIEPEREIG